MSDFKPEDIEAAGLVWHADCTPKTFAALRAICTPMFEALAEHHNEPPKRVLVPTAELVATAQRYLPFYAVRWNPPRGRLWIWLSKCMKGRFAQCECWEREARLPVHERFPNRLTKDDRIS